MNFSVGERINREFLDTIDFIPFLDECGTVDDLMAKVEQTVSMIGAPPELMSEPFNYMNEEDVADYLINRYPYYCFPEDIKVIHYITGPLK